MPSTITVNSGSLWSIENAEHAAGIYKGAGRGVGPVGCHFRIGVLSPTAYRHNGRTKHDSGAPKQADLSRGATDAYFEDCR